MGCTAGATVTELELVQQLNNRWSGQCIGPLVELAFNPDHLDRLDAALECADEDTWHTFWDGFEDNQVHGYPLPVFSLCAVHWMDLSHMLWLMALAERRRDWVRMSVTILREICQGAGWDPKEMSNLFAWSRLSLA